jgi:amidophosphoribosyltransferase
MLRQDSTNRVFVVKDPHGFRPLVLGKLDGGFVAASESCAFDLVGAELIREVEPGELVELTATGIKSSFLTKKAEPAPCIFEWIYFSRPDSHVFDRSVYEMRKKLGVLLAENDLKAGVKADLVMGVPDSGIPAAIGYSQRAQLPFELGLIRNHYIGRTFIEPHQSIRDFGVRIKQNPLRESLKGKSIIVVDDSLVRGTTSKKINKILREAGVKEIHMRISAPPTISPCFYGIDTPHESELIAANKSIQQITDFVEADSIRYLEMDSIYKHLKPPTSMCDACFTKKYRAPIS